jgi:hypothetical protein
MTFLPAFDKKIYTPQLTPGLSENKLIIIVYIYMYIYPEMLKCHVFDHHFSDALW